MKVKAKVSDLIAVIKDENATYEQKKVALEKLQKISNGYLDGLTQENIATAEGTRLLNRYISSIDRLAKAKALVNVKAKLEEQKLESDSKITGLSVEKKENTNEGIISTRGEGDDGKFLGLGSRNKVEIQGEIDEEKRRSDLISKQQQALTDQRTKEINNMRASIAMLTGMLGKVKKDSDRYKELVQDIKTNTDALNILTGVSDESDLPTIVPSAYVPDAAGDKAKKDAEKEAERAKKEADRLHKQRMADLEKQIDELRNLQRRGIDDKLALMKEGFEKEKALEDENHRRKIEDLERDKISDTDISKAEVKMQDPKASKREVDYWNRQAQVWIEKNQQLDQLIELEKQTHYSRLGIIVEREDQRQIKELDKQYNREKAIRETDFNYQLADLRSLQEAKALLASTLGGKELAAITTLDDAKKALREQFNNNEIEQQQIHLEKMIADLERMTAPINFKGIDLNILTPEQRASMQEQIEQLQLLLSQLEAAKSGNATAGTDGSLDGINSDAAMNAFGDTDVLGFTVQQWQDTFNNLDTVQGKMEAVKMGVSAMQNLWTAFGNFLTANENAQLNKFTKNSDAKKRKLKWQLDNGYINQATYKKQLELLDADLEKKKMDLEYKQAKRAKTMAIVDAVINTAKGVTAALGMAPPASFIFAGIAAALGALQIATIAKQPLPAKGYEKGLYPEYVQREQDGKVFKSTYGGKTRSGMVRTPTHFLAGENGPEMIIDAKAWKQIPEETKSALIRNLRGIKGFEQGYYNKDVTGRSRIEVPAATAATAATGSLGMDAMIMALNRNSEVLEKLADQGVVAYWNKDPRDLKKLQEDMDKVKSSRDKAKL